MSGQALTYGVLDERARAVAASLQEISRLGSGLCCSIRRAWSFSRASLGASTPGSSASRRPSRGLRLKRSGPRLRSIANDAQASLVLTTSKIRAIIKQSKPPVFEQAIRWLITDEVDLAAAKGWRNPADDGRPCLSPVHLRLHHRAPRG